MNIYMMGICGTGMGNLAIMLKNIGHNVFGSDEGIYPPMSEQLKRASIPMYEGFSEDNLKQQDIDLVIIGNVIRKTNPEAQYVLQNGIDYMSMAEALNSFFMKDKERYVVAGTHGKTTTSFMLATALEELGKEPGFFIGGIPKNFGVMGRATNSNTFVIEGDEYDTAFFDKKAKFLNYYPKYLIITSIEYDHADIYDNLEQILDAFTKLVEGMPSDGIIVYNKADTNVRSVIEHSNIKARLVSYNTDDADYFYHKVFFSAGTVSFYVGNTHIELQVPGKHNISNATAVFSLLSELGLDKKTIADGLKNFKGVKRRQDLLYTIGDITVIDDFAHHPTAVSLTIEAIREWYPNRRLWAIFEPRTATTRTKIVEPALMDSLKEADKVIIAPVHQPERVSEADRLNPQRLANMLQSNGVDAYAPGGVAKIIDTIIRYVKSGDLILIMSNGGFGGIYKKLQERLKEVVNGILTDRG